MTTKEVAERFSQLTKENNYPAIYEELYAENTVSIEPPTGLAQGLQNAEGMPAILKKGEMFRSMIEEMHSGYTSEPVVGGTYFSVAMGMDVTMKGMGRVQMDEIAVYEVNDGKIIKEEFFY